MREFWSQNFYIIYPEHLLYLAQIRHAQYQRRISAPVRGFDTQKAKLLNN